jgi:hypothetical protein
MGWASGGRNTTGPISGAVDFNLWHEWYFFVGGKKVNGPALQLIIAAGIFKHGAETNYYILTRSKSNASTMKFWKGTMPAAGGNGEINPTWTNTESYLFSDFLDTPYTATQWGYPTGTAYVSPKGKAYFSLCMEKEDDVDGATIQKKLVLMEADLITGDLIIKRDNSDSLPWMEASWSEVIENGTSHEPMELYEFPCTPDFGGQTPVDTSAGDPGSFSQTYSAQYTNKNRKNGTIIRTFGGLDKLYIYESTIDYSGQASFNGVEGGATQEIGEVTWDCALPPLTRYADWITYKRTVNLTRSDTENGVATVNCYSSTNGESQELVDSLVVWEYTVEIAANQSYPIWNKAIPIVGATVSNGGYNWEVSQTTGEIAPNISPVGGSAVLRLTTRRILDHHPQIKNSWVYIEDEAEWNLIARTGTRTIRYIDKGVTKHEIVCPVLTEDPFTASQDATDSNPGHRINGDDDGPFPIGKYVYGYGVYSGVNPIPRNADTGDILGLGLNTLSGSRTPWTPAAVPGTFDKDFLVASFGRAHINTSDPGEMRDLEPQAQSFWTVGSGSSGPDIGLFDVVWPSVYFGEARYFGQGHWGTGQELSFPAAGELYRPATVAVHRKTERRKEKPYIWLKKDVYADEVATGVGKTYKRVIGAWFSGGEPSKTDGLHSVIGCFTSPSDYDLTVQDFANGVTRVIGDLANYHIWWTKTPTPTPTTGYPPFTATNIQTLATSDWYIESNILTEEQIKTLTGEISVDIFEVGII